MRFQVVLFFCFTFATKCFGGDDPPVPTLPLPPPIQYTHFNPTSKTRTFMGNVRCADGRPLSDNAVMFLNKKQDGEEIIVNTNRIDDYFLKADPDSVQSGLFQMYVPLRFTRKGNYTGDLYLYLEFLNICYDGQYKISGFLKDDYWVEYIIDDNAPYAIPKEPE